MKRTFEEILLMDKYDLMYDKFCEKYSCKETNTLMIMKENFIKTLNEKQKQDFEKLTKLYMKISHERDKQLMSFSHNYGIIRFD